MRRMFAASLAVALGLALTSPSTVSAQAVAYFGGGATIPTQDYAEFPGGGGDGANTGWLGFAGLYFPLGDTGFAPGIQGYYGQNSHDTDGDRTDLYGVLATGGFAFGEADASARPFVSGGLGTMTHSYKSEDFPSAEGSATSLAAQLTGGLSFALGGATGFVAASATTGFGDNSETTYIGIAAALGFLLGGG